MARRGYNESFEEWGVRDAQDMVLRDRNHPSVILWSIGNEIDYLTDPFVHPRGRVDNSIPKEGAQSKFLSADLMPAFERQLIAAVKRFDATRPVTMALADINASNATGVAGMLDIVGYNYLEQYYDREHKAYPNRVIYGSENSRGLDQWRQVAVNSYVGGQFLWTGMNFIGEANRWPIHGSNSGLLDLEGFWKPDAYLRQALWSEKPMVYAVAKGAGQLEVYSNSDSVELLLNGRSLGEKPIADRLSPSLVFAIPNETGAMEVVGRKAGIVVARFQLKTPGPPDRIELTPDLTTLKDDGRQVSTVEIRIVDRDGNRIGGAAGDITFEVTGAGRLLAAANADLNDASPINSGHTKLYQGRAVAIVRSFGGPGKITLRAASLGLTAAEIVFVTLP